MRMEMERKLQITSFKELGMCNPQDFANSLKIATRHVN